MTPHDSSRVRLLIVGAGSIGERHARVFGQLGTETTVVDIRPGRAREVAQRYGCAGAYSILEEVRLDSFDGAIICTPADSHIRLGRQCVEAGLHLMIEKPLAASAEEAEEFIAVCRERERVLAVAYVLRHHPTVVRARELLRQGALGEIVSIQAVCAHHVSLARPDYRNTYFGTARMGGGVVLDLSHEPNYIDWIAGPLEVVMSRTAVVHALEVETEAIADIILRTSAGAPVNLHLHACDFTSRREFSIVGTDATVHGDLITGEFTLQDAATRHRWRDQVSDRDDIYRDQAQSFLRAIREGEVPRCSGEEGLRTLRTCLDALWNAQHDQLRAAGR